MSGESFAIENGTAVLAGEQVGAGEPLIFLHAGVADRRMWHPQMADLSDTYQVVAYDRRGFGQATTTDEPFSDVADLQAVLDGLGVRRAALAGCSQGGRVAIDFALAYPERVRALLMIAPAVSGAPSPDAYPPGVEALDQELEAADEAGDMARINEIEAQFWLDGPTSAPGRVGGAVRELFLDMNGIALAMPELEQEVEPAPAYERVSELALPVLVIWGDLDFPHVIARCTYLVEAIPGAKGVEIQGTAHLPNLEQPDVVNRLLRAHLA